MNKQQIVEILHSHTDGLRIGEREWIYGKVADEILALLYDGTTWYGIEDGKWEDDVYLYFKKPQKDVAPDWVGVDLKKYYDSVEEAVKILDGAECNSTMAIDEDGILYFKIFSNNHEYDDDLLERRLKGYE